MVPWQILLITGKKAIGSTVEAHIMHSVGWGPKDMYHVHDERGLGTESLLIRVEAMMVRVKGGHA
jgi:hypothetical protein